MTRSIKLCPPPGMPSRWGICVTAMLRPAPALNPSRIVSLIKSISELSRNSHARVNRAAATNAARVASCAKRTGSPNAGGGDGSPDHQRDGGSRPNRKMAGGAKQRVAYSAEQIPIDTNLWGQASEGSIRDSFGQRVRPKCNTRQQIASQPTSLISRHPLCRWKDGFPSTDFRRAGNRRCC